MKEYDQVRFVVDGKGDDGKTIPAGTIGTVVDVAPDGYAVDIELDGEYDNVHATPDQVERVEPAQQ